ncbi:MAG: S9 family peptidase [Pseudomonadota bacterium]|nr:S9 family peptidase [Pseudomonadota bacterium]
MNKFWLHGAAIAALTIAAPATAQQAHSLADDAAAFGAREAVSAARLSPDGSSILYLTPGPGPKSFAVISNLETGKSAKVIDTDGNPESLQWCNYSGPRRVVCSIVGNVMVGPDLDGFRRLVSMTSDGVDAKLLGRPMRVHDNALHGVDAVVLDWRGGQDGKILVERSYVPTISETLQDHREGLGVDLVDTISLKSETVEPPNPSSSGYMTDGRGHVRIMTVVDYSRGKMHPLNKYLYRTQGSREWKSLVGYQEDSFDPLEIDADLDSVYALKKKDGRMELYRIKLDGSMAETFIADDPKVDIGGVIRVGEGQRVIAYFVEGDKPRTVYFDTEFAALNTSLRKALPNSPIIHFVDTTSDGRKMLIYAGSDNDPGRYYVFDRDHKSLNEAMVERPELAGHRLAQMTPVTVSAQDGAQIPAYLTIPAGSSGKNLPAIVMPHGGPSSRDYWDFDWLSQFFAARGYVVIQPEYRGSEGYGDQWLNTNGFRNWTTSMSDIADSARWLAKQGIANPDRIAIVGWSYGGYAALQSAATYPALYKGVVAIAPVTDLATLKKDSSFYGRSEFIENFIGSGPYVTSGSPLQNASKIRVPVLLVHGDLDTNVKFHQSQMMYDKLKSLGGNVEFLSYKGLDHQLRDATVRAQFLTKAAELLDKTIGH